MRELRARHPMVEFRGMGGPRMEAQGLESRFPLETLSVMGLVPSPPGKVEAEAIERAVATVMDLTPRGIREHLDLNKPIYARTSAYGHFGRAPEADGGFSWEKTDLTEALKAAV